MININLDRDQQPWPSTLKHWIEDTDSELKRVRFLKKLLRNFDKQNEVQKIVECPKKGEDDFKQRPQRVKTKIYKIPTPEKPKIINIPSSINNCESSSIPSINSYCSILSDMTIDPDLSKIIDESKYYTAYEHISDSKIMTENEINHTISKNEPIIDETFVRNSKVTKSCKNNVSDANKSLQRRCSFRNSMREIKNRFVVNIYESRVPNRANSTMENEKKCSDGEILYSTPKKPERKSKVKKEKNKSPCNISCIENPKNEVVEEFVELSGSPVLAGPKILNESANQLQKNPLNFTSSTDSGFSETGKAKESPKSPKEKLNTSDIFFSLKQKADVQGHIMKQASRALESFRKQYNDEPATGEILAEKILLISSFTHEAILQEIRQNQYENMILGDEKHSASLSITGLTFNLKRNTIDHDHRYFFVCICSKGTTVHVTETVEAKPGEKTITFQNAFVFDELDIDFIVNVNVYMLKIKKKNRTKFTFSRVRTCCNPSRRVLYKDTYSYNVVETEILNSSFVPCGGLQVRIGDLNKEIWDFENVPDYSPLTGVTDLKFAVTKLNIDTNLRGFLTVGTSSKHGIVWNRMWCKISGDKLKFWNYPSDENVNRPVNVVEMKKIKSKQIDFAKRSTCPRPRTLYFEVEDGKLTYETLTRNRNGDFQVGYYKNVVYYLSADTQKEAEIWRENLNSVVTFLKRWSTKEVITYL